MLTTIFVIFLISSIVCNAVNLTDRFGAAVKRTAAKFEDKTPS